MNLFASLTKIATVAVQNAPAGGKKRSQSGPECTPCAAAAYVQQNAATVQQYAGRPKKKR